MEPQSIRGELTLDSSRPLGSTQEDWSCLSFSWQCQISFHKTCHCTLWCLAFEGPFLWCSAVGTSRFPQARTCGFRRCMSCIHTDGHSKPRTRIRMSNESKFMSTLDKIRNNSEWRSLTTISRQLGAGGGSGFGHDPGSNLGAIFDSTSAQAR